MYPAKNLMKNMENIFRESEFYDSNVFQHKLNAIVYSFLATIRSLFGHYDIVHFHAEGPCIMLWLTKTVWNPDSGDDSWAGLAAFQMGKFCISCAEAGKDRRTPCG